VLLRRQRSGGSWFKASLEKKFMRPHLNKYLSFQLLGKSNRRLEVQTGLGGK
jgi:hypothetical protein